MGDRTFEEDSRNTWSRDGGSTMDDVKLGCLQRIAKATEIMAKNHDSLIRQRDEATKSRDYWRTEAEIVQRRLSAARGQITKLKNAAKKDAMP